MEFLPDSEDYGRIAMAVAVACCCSSDHSSTKMQSSANETTVLKGDRLDRVTAMRDWTAGPMEMKVVSPDQELLIGCEPAFGKLANRDRRAVRCLT